MNAKVCSVVAHLELHGSSAEQVKIAFQEAGLECSMDNCQAVAKEYCPGESEDKVTSTADDLFFALLDG